MHDERDLLAVGRIGQLEHAGLARHRALDADLDLAQHRLALALREPRVDRHRGRAEDQAAVERLEEREPGLEQQRDRLAAARPAEVQGARRTHRAQQQLAVRDLLVARRDRDALGAAPGGAREPMAEVHSAQRLMSPAVSVQWTTAAEYEDIRYELSGDGIAKVTIDRPEVRNAFRPQTVIELSDALERARGGPVGRRDRAHRRGAARVLLGR